MGSDRDRRLVALEALPRQAAPGIEPARLGERLELMTYLAARRPHESACEAIARLLGVGCGAIHSGDFAARWDELMRPLRELEGPAFVAACEDIRARFVDSATSVA